MTNKNKSKGTTPAPKVPDKDKPPVETPTEQTKKGEADVGIGITNMGDVGEFSSMESGQSLSDFRMRNAFQLTKLLKFSKKQPDNFIKLEVGASKLIFSIYGHMNPHYNNQLMLYNIDGNLLFKIKFLPALNKVVVNNWVESTDIFEDEKHWPQNLTLSFNESVVRINNIIIYEFVDNVPRNYRYINSDIMGVTEMQLLSINESQITAEDIIKKK